MCFDLVSESQLCLRFFGIYAEIFFWTETDRAWGPKAKSFFPMMELLSQTPKTTQQVRRFRTSKDAGLDESLLIGQFLEEEKRRLLG